MCSSRIRTDRGPVLRPPRHATADQPNQIARGPFRLRASEQRTCLSSVEGAHCACTAGTVRPTRSHRRVPRRLQVNQDAAFHRSDRKSWPKGNPDNSFVGWVKGASRHLAFARCRCLAARLPPATSRCAGRSDLARGRVPAETTLTLMSVVGSGCVQLPASFTSTCQGLPPGPISGAWPGAGPARPVRSPPRGRARPSVRGSHRVGCCPTR